MRFIEKRRYPLTAVGLSSRWLLCPLALVADTLVTLVVTPFGYDSGIYDSYLEFAIGLKLYRKPE